VRRHPHSTLSCITMTNTHCRDGHAPPPHCRLEGTYDAACAVNPLHQQHVSATDDIWHYFTCSNCLLSCTQNAVVDAHDPAAAASFSMPIPSCFSLPPFYSRLQPDFPSTPHRNDSPPVHITCHVLNRHQQLFPTTPMQRQPRSAPHL